MRDNCQDNKCIMSSCLYFTTNTLSRKINQMADEAFALTGLSPSHGYLLMIVLDSPGKCQSDLCEIMQVQPSTMTRFVEKLVNCGMIRKELCGRNATIYPTEKAEDYKEKFDKASTELYNKYMKILGEEFALELTNKISKANELIKD